MDTSGRPAGTPPPLDPNAPTIEGTPAATSGGARFDSAAAAVRGAIGSTATTPPGADDLFAPGAILGDRYRIVALLGRGGMGEVYRADDLKLGQPVALKFLPRALERDSNRLVRLLDELRTAREVSHPNVCRMYDVGEAAGRHFLSMEYIDGEDLTSLLRRIGRLPSDKALEIGRQLCAGLAAAHDRGVLHRDLKPANVMLDGRGKVRLTDFGLAEMAGAGRGDFAGTPGYMAPEQFAGEPASIQSDIYALGLVLYEVFTGKRMFEADTIGELRRLHEHSRPASMARLIHDVDPAIERVIHRCLEKDARNRPASAIAVAAALPGGDPLAAALAAGETPSPDMVAAAGEQGGLRPSWALAWLGAIGVALIAAVAIAGSMSALGRERLDFAPEVMKVKAQEMLGRLGYVERPADTDGRYEVDADYFAFGRRSKAAMPRLQPAVSSGYAGIVYWYRGSPRPLVPSSFVTGSGLLGGGGWVSFDDPTNDAPGMTALRLDSNARLLELRAGFERREPATITPAQAPDWQRVITETGVAPASVKPVTPEWVPPSWADARAAWTAQYADMPGVDLRIEAAAYRGRVVYVSVMKPWTGAQSNGQQARSIWTALLGAFEVLMLLASIGGALAIGRRNLRLGRGDRRGAARVAVAGMLLVLGSWAFKAHHVATTEELLLVIQATAWSLFFGGWGCLLYLAIEPYIRRRWPHALIGWTRLLGGRWRDPLVGRDLLIGCSAGLLAALLAAGHLWLRSSIAGVAMPPATPTLIPLHGARFVGHILCYYLFQAGLSTLLLFFILFLLRLVVRRDWLLVVAVLLLTAAAAFATSDSPIADALGTSVGWLLTFFVLLRFGLLALTAATLLQTMLSVTSGSPFPVSLDFGSWLGGPTLIAVVFIAALAFYAYRISLGGKTLLGNALDE